MQQPNRTNFWTRRNTHTYIFAIATLVFICLEILAIKKSSHYRYDIAMCLLLLYLGYRWKSELVLQSGHYALAAVFLLIHCLGVFGLYTSYPLGVEYDYWIHGFFGVVAALISMHYFRSSTSYPETILITTTIVLVMGIAAFHELYEFAGAVLLGEGEGVLFIGAGDLDQWDTHKDILNNLLGAILGTGYSFVKQKSKFQME